MCQRQRNEFSSSTKYTVGTIHPKTITILSPVKFTVESGEVITQAHKKARSPFVVLNVEFVK